MCLQKLSEKQICPNSRPEPHSLCSSMSQISLRSVKNTSQSHEYGVSFVSRIFRGSDKTFSAAFAFRSKAPILDAFVTQACTLPLNAFDSECHSVQEGGFKKEKQMSPDSFALTQSVCSIPGFADGFQMCFTCAECF